MPTPVSRHALSDSSIRAQPTVTMRNMSSTGMLGLGLNTSGNQS
jgi:hypothetical protein